MSWRILLILLVGITGMAPVAAADSTRQVKWEDLTPPLEKFVDPFLTLTFEQKVDLRRVADTRLTQAGGGTIAPEQLDLLNAALKRLRSAKIDIDGLLAMRAEITAKRKQASETVNKNLNGQQVRLAGYVLPLEANGTKVTEFLLVPYVGACIHEPVPPANQIVLVKFEPGFEVQGRFTPVWVQGKLTTQSGTRKLFLVDGSSDIPSGYTLAASAVEPYKK